ncbi:MAG TPA: sulfite exporter TauE/SafE family protein [Polyangiales bacterium]|nr:sulfite exporter TauE/SafE family protein [Polyangiales bacterium]
MPTLALLFLLTAVLYASVGFGGGSTYNALLVLADTDYRILPSVALVCNLIVVAGGVWQYRRSGDLNLAFALPFVALSIPLAWFGGSVPIERETFVMLLGVSLLAAGLVMWFQAPESKSASSGSWPVLWLAGLPLGAVIGFLSGMVGIGGGIFLAPALHLLRLGDPKRIAATSSFFIMVNSIAGLVGQATKRGSAAHLAQLADYFWLGVAVLIGGQIGSRLSAEALSGRVVKRLTAVLVLYVAGRLLYLSFS